MVSNSAFSFDSLNAFEAIQQVTSLGTARQINLATTSSRRLWSMVPIAEQVYVMMGMPVTGVVRVQIQDLPLAVLLTRVASRIRVRSELDRTILPQNRDNSPYERGEYRLGQILFPPGPLSCVIASIVHSARCLEVRHSSHLDQTSYCPSKLFRDLTAWLSVLKAPTCVS